MKSYELFIIIKTTAVVRMECQLVVSLPGSDTGKELISWPIYWNSTGLLEREKQKRKNNISKEWNYLEKYLTKMSEENQARKRKGGSSNGSDPSKERPRPFQGRYNPKHSDKYGMVSHKTIAKFVMLIGAVIFVVYSSYRAENVHPMAKVNEILDKKRHAQFLCHPHFKKEIQELSEACVPAKCGRFVVDDLVTVDEAHKLLVLAKKGLAKGGGNGGASILDLHSGALSHGDNFINLYKSHPELFTARDFETYRTIKNRVKAAVAEHFNLDNNQLYLSHPTFFSELTSVPAVTVHDEYWHPHIDKV